MEALAALAQLLEMGANGVLVVFGYVLLRHELRLTRLEAQKP